DNKKITIAHEAIPAVNWPPMTMRFTITPQTQLNNVKDGDSVDFTFVQQENRWLLQDIRAQYRPGAGRPPQQLNGRHMASLTLKNTALILGSMLIGGALTAALYARWAPT
ncbi:copper-binding protein, partial [Acinetobacter variabilis]|uniref:copper-binding protein n=1 Tax=Acinetobacter variabilis TaxID=70346 RepID=UPI0030F4E24B